jgi:Cof subfamily protein (haloacid dehalogenase superfamily)
LIRLLALDLDGTVLTSDLRLDERDVEAIGQAQTSGMVVVACTGRPFPGALPWVRRLGLTQPIVCYQGAQVRTPDGAMLLDQGVPHEVAMEVVRFAASRGVHVQAYRDDELIVEHDRPEAHEYANHAGMEIHVVGDLDAAMGPTTPKLVIVARPEVCLELLPLARQRWAGKLEVATSMPNFLEFTRAGADKSRALQFLCDRLVIRNEETAAVGDGRNDVPMLAWAGRGYAVEGSPPEVIEAAGGRTVGRPGTGGIARLVRELSTEG